MYPLTPNPNLARTDTAAVFQQPDWGRDMALLSQYAMYANRYGTKGGNKGENNDKELQQWLKFDLNPSVVNPAAQKNLLAAKQTFEDQAIAIYQKYPDGVPMEEQVKIQRAKDKLLQYQANLIHWQDMYDKSYADVTNPESAHLWDAGYFQEQSKKFQEQGYLPDGESFKRVTRGDMEKYLEGVINESPKETSTATTEKGGIKTVEEITSYPTWSDQRTKEEIEKAYKTNPWVQMDVDMDYTEYLAKNPADQGKYANALDWAKQNEKYLGYGRPRTAVKSTAPITSESEMTETEKDKIIKRTENGWVPRKKIPYDYPVETYYEQNSDGTLKPVKPEKVTAFKNAAVIGFVTKDNQQLAVLGTNADGTQISPEDLAALSDTQKLNVIIAKALSGEKGMYNIKLIPLEEAYKNLKAADYRLEDYDKYKGSFTSNAPE